MFRKAFKLSDSYDIVEVQASIFIGDSPFSFSP
jgi:hypothetical protein